MKEFKMKRSEIYKLMVNTMIDDLPDLNNINTLDITVCMDTVLKAIETAGMLPPEVKDHTMMNCMGLGEDAHDYFYWEPEE
tara:strand:+ start:2604 stop:2846 length:243 start_codon:yes stop_codon:yes gene_type:complete